MVARTTLFESAARSIEPDSDIVCVGIFAVAEVTSRLLPDISTEKEEFFAASLIKTLFSPGLLPVTSTTTLPGRVTPDRSKTPVAWLPELIGPAMVVVAPEISLPSEFLSFTSTSPSGMTRSFTIVSERDPELNTASEKSLKLKLFVTGSRSNEGMSTLLPSGISFTLGYIDENKYGAVVCGSILSRLIIPTSDWTIFSMGSIPTGSNPIVSSTSVSSIVTLSTLWENCLLISSIDSLSPTSCLSIFTVLLNTKIESPLPYDSFVILESPVRMSTSFRVIDFW